MSEQRKLFQRCGNVCAFPDCMRKLTADATLDDPLVVLGEIAHIIAESNNGPRGRSPLTKAQRNRYDNLILLCNQHHQLIDSQPDTWTTSRLREMKAAHEDWVARRLCAIDNVTGLPDDWQRVSRSQPAGLIVVGEIPQEPTHFVARAASAHLRHFLDRSRSVVVIVGMRGVGKTQLAGTVARGDIHSGRGLVGWVNADSPETTRAGLADIAERLGAADPQGDSAVSARRLRDHLSGRAEPGLLVLDNAANPDLIRALLPVGGHTRVLITTTDRSFASLGEVINLDGFTRPESIRYLNDSTSLADNIGAEQIAEEVGDLPLALSAAAATISGRRLDYPGYQRLLRSQQLPKALARRAGHDYPRSVVQAILLSIDTTEAATNDADLDLAVNGLLGLIAMLSPGGVRRAILPDAAGRLDEVIERCAVGSLLSWSANGDTIIMHRLVGRVLRERAQSVPEVYDLTPDASDPVRALYTGVDLSRLTLAVIERGLFDQSEAWVRREEGSHLVDQIDALWNTGIPATTDSDLLNRMFSVRAWAVAQLHAAADTARSIALGRDTLTDSERLLGPNHPATLKVRNELARVYASVGRAGEAIALWEANLKDCERIFGSNDKATLTTRTNLTSAYHEAGRLDEAITLHATNLIEFERILGLDHPETLRCRNNLAGAYNEAGQLGEAIILHRANISACARIFGPDHSNTRIARINLASAYTSAGRLDQAVALCTKNLCAHERLLGPYHPDTLRCRNNLASALQSAGRLDEAITLYQRNLTDCEHLFGSDHQNTIRSRNNLACALKSTGRLDEAVTLQKANLFECEQALGSANALTRIVRENLCGGG
ncbi:tetratricopeptide repeat protein [Nocardia sp. NPDC005745]|uniref:tetratricopeptide repeat protein n=1 Tax=Nocardia sp. NPDC005745 TaxID=3157061 RepID=UPI0033C85591